MAATHQNRSDGLFPLLLPFVHADQTWGYALGAGGIFNGPGGLTLAVEANYAKGAASYTGLYDSFGVADDEVVDAAAYSYNVPLGSIDMSRAWSATVDLGYAFTPSFTGHLVASYASYDGPDALHTITIPEGEVFLPGGADFKTWAATANLTYTIVQGLTLAGEISAEHHDYDGLTSFQTPIGSAYSKGDFTRWSGGARLKRTF